ncbi:MAG: hypothetical protein JSC085_000823 [Candidatus Tokpelaia sp. JSC085]|nr:MAG: hypothetical protein JSC085_000823 [Candidatus Tokpelaia sp. JSC085]
MARRTKAKAEEFDIEVEAALKEALDFDFENALANASETENNIESFAEELLDVEEVQLPTVQQSTSSASPESEQNQVSFIDNMRDGQGDLIKSGADFDPRDTETNPLHKLSSDRASECSPRSMGTNNPRKRTRLLDDPLYWTTSALSAVWAVGGGAIAYSLAETLDEGEGIASFLASGPGMLIAAGTIVPICMIWGLAQLAQRARVELRQAVDTMTGAARHLLEPETTSGDCIAKTIRREFTAIDENIERTVSRVSELEALLQNEVNNLEQAYSENEARIRTLVVELANEREAVAVHSNNLRDKMVGSKDQLIQEFKSIADHINATADSLTITLSESLNARWNELVHEFDLANKDVVQQLSQQFVAIFQNFDVTSSNFLEEFSSRLSQINQHTEEASKAIAAQLGTNMDDCVELVYQRTEGIKDSVNRLTNRLANHGKKIIKAVDHIEKRSVDVDQRLRCTMDKVLNDFDDRFQKLNNVVVDRGTQSLSEFSEQIIRIENCAHGLPLVFDSVAEKTVDKFSKQINRIEEDLGSFSSRFCEHGDVLAETISNNLSKIEERSVDVDTRLSAATSKILDAFEDGVNTLDNTFIHHRDHAVNKFSAQLEELKKRAQDMSSCFDTVSRLAMQAFEERFYQVNHSIHEKNASLLQSFNARTDELEESANKLGTVLETHVDRVNQAFQLRTRDITEILAGGRHDILSVIDEIKISLLHEIEVAGTTISRLVDEKSGSILFQFVEERANFGKMLEVESKRIFDTVKNQINTLSQTVSDTEGMLLSRITTLEEQAREHVENIEKKTVAFEKTIMNSFSIAREAIEVQVKNIDVHAGALLNSLSLNSETLNKVLSEQAEMLEKRTARICEVIADSSSTLSNAISGHVDVFRKSLFSNDEILKKTFVDHLQTLEDQMNYLKNVFNNNQMSLLHSLDERICLLQDSLVSSRTDIETVFSEHNLMVSDQTVKLQNTLVQTFSTVDEKLDKQERLLEKRACKLRESVDYNSTVLEGSFLKQTACIEEQTKIIQKTLDIGVNNVRNFLENNALCFTDSIVHAVNNIDQRLTERTVFLKENILHIEEIISGGFKSIEGRVAEITQKTTQHLSAQTDNLYSLTENFKNSATETSDSLGTLTNQFSEQMKEVTRSAEDRLRLGHDAFINSFLGHTQEAVCVVKSATSEIESNITKLIERLDISNNSLHHTVSMLRDNVHEVDTHLVDVTSEFKKNIGQVAENFKTSSSMLNGDLQNFTTLSQNALNNVATFSKKFDSHAKLLTEATRILDISGAMFVEQLETKQAVLNALAAGLVSKSDEVTEIIQNCEHVIISVLKSVEDRTLSSTNQLQSSLSELINEAARKFVGATEDIRKSSEEVMQELTRTRADLNQEVHLLPVQTKEYTAEMRKAVMEQSAALKELSSVVEASSRLLNHLQPVKAGLQQRFQQVVSTETAIMAAESDNGIDMLQKSTHPSSSIPRDVQSGRDVLEDTSPFKDEYELVQRTPLDECSNSIPRDVQSGRDVLEDTSPFTDEYELVQRTPLDECSNSIPRDVQSGRDVLEDTSPFKDEYELVQRTPLDECSNSIPRDVQSGRDVLEDTSPFTDEYELVQRTPLDECSKETLNSMSVDIVQGIDNHAILQLWQSYRSGQRNIMPNRLYTIAGQQTFEKIKRQYFVDGNLRQAVSQYISDFERLLRKAGESSNNMQATATTIREYLTSDTGKVYTMLAHVSGRIQ